MAMEDGGGVVVGDRVCGNRGSGEVLWEGGQTFLLAGVASS